MAATRTATKLTLGKPPDLSDATCSLRVNPSANCKRSPFSLPYVSVGARFSKLWGGGGGVHVQRRGAASSALVGRLEEELSSIRSGGTWKTEYVITSAQDVSIKVEGRTDGILNFCANNYLGLSVISLFPLRIFTFEICFTLLLICR